MGIMKSGATSKYYRVIQKQSISSQMMLYPISGSTHEAVIESAKPSSFMPNTTSSGAIELLTSHMELIITVESPSITILKYPNQIV